MSTKTNFALIGAGGYVAPKHMKAIRDVGGKLVAALDPADSVGILDKYSYDVAFFTEFERFDRHAEKLRRLDHAHRLHYVSICSPNYLHDAHIRFALRIGADAICEKPLVLNPWNLDALAELEQETGGRIHCLLQLRLLPGLVVLKASMDSLAPGNQVNVDLTYVTSRDILPTCISSPTLNGFDSVRLYADHSQDGQFGKSSRHPAMSRQFCPKLNHTFVVGAEGRFSRCNHIWQTEQEPTLHEKSIKDIWNSPAMLHIRQTYPDPQCAVCDQWTGHTTGEAWRKNDHGMIEHHVYGPPATNYHL